MKGDFSLDLFINKAIKATMCAEPNTALICLCSKQTLNDILLHPFSYIFTSVVRNKYQYVCIIADIQITFIPNDECGEDVIFCKSLSTVSTKDIYCTKE